MTDHPHAKNSSPLLVVDLEAMCWENRHTPSGEPQSIQTMEIIEFGCALATRQGELLESRSFLVQPTFSPELSTFCTSLTGISQTMVDQASYYPAAVRQLGGWLGQRATGSIWCSWGNSDRFHILAEGQKHRCTPSFMARPHLNLKRIWRRTTGRKRKNGLTHALAYHQLAFNGHHHRGVDDTRNMARLLPFMDWGLEAELLTYPGQHSQGSEEKP